uniref:Uncharacterized protein n=1 Tax=Tanacetum cinerariifolium TaxID=118510 RepID=A0A699HVA3_TANCI|nr:hypothetical protein [Tanacetum cinerariifolium]
MAGENIYNLTMEQYLTLAKRNQELGVVRPEIKGNVNFKITSQFIRGLREETFSKNKNDDACEHIERVLDIVSLFNISGVTLDAVMLLVFLITLTGAAKRLGRKDLYQAWESHLLDSHGPILGMTPAEGMAAIVSKLDNLGQDMKKLNKNVHAIQVGWQLYGGPQ